MGHCKILEDISRLLPTRREEALRREWSDTTEFVLFVADVIRHLAFMEKISIILIYVIKIDS
jgi:hypothetical protein